MQHILICFFFFSFFFFLKVQLSELNPGVASTHINRNRAGNRSEYGEIWAGMSFQTDLFLCMYNCCHRYGNLKSQITFIWSILFLFFKLYYTGKDKINQFGDWLQPRTDSLQTFVQASHRYHCLMKFRDPDWSPFAEDLLGLSCLQ